MNFFEFNTEETKRKEKCLADKLKELLSLLSLMKIKKNDCIYEGLKEITKTYNETTAWINESLYQNNMQTVPSIHHKKHFDTIKRDFIKLVNETEPNYQLEEIPEETTHRVNLMAWYLVAYVTLSALREIAKSESFNVVQWITMRDGSVCEVCLDSEGYYSLHELPSYPPHPLCRCRLKLWRVTTKDSSLTRRIRIGDMYQHSHESPPTHDNGGSESMTSKQP